MGSEDDETWEDFESKPTTLEIEAIPEVETAPHLGIEFLAGREAGWSDACRDVLSTLKEELIRAGVDEADTAKIIDRIRFKSQKKG